MLWNVSVDINFLSENVSSNTIITILVDQFFKPFYVTWNAFVTSNLSRLHSMWAGY